MLIGWVTITENFLPGPPHWKLAGSPWRALVQGRLQDQQVAELKELRAQLSSTQSHQTRLRAQLYEARQTASAQVHRPFGKLGCDSLSWSLTRLY